ncbi:Carcinine transporter [Eumeta japonica]|uniref:Carcinine transporter n=1 Tax=Eumeta variegata TaxID=151549 RepID=A0A4C1WYU3_EUMVA|nr:Carcinine transporter [Eumeta japonica]
MPPQERTGCCEEEEDPRQISRTNTIDSRGNLENNLSSIDLGENSEQVEGHRGGRPWLSGEQRPQISTWYQLSTHLASLISFELFPDLRRVPVARSPLHRLASRFTPPPAASSAHTDRPSDIPTQKANNALTTPLELRMSMGVGYVNKAYTKDGSEDEAAKTRRPDEDREPEKKATDFDDLLPHVGEFGLYQKILFLLMIPFAFFVAFVYFSQIFMTITPEQHWCWIPELANLSVEDSRLTAKLDAAEPRPRNQSRTAPAAPRYKTPPARYAVVHRHEEVACDKMVNELRREGGASRPAPTTNSLTTVQLVKIKGLASRPEGFTKPSVSDRRQSRTRTEPEWL